MELIYKYHTNTFTENEKEVEREREENITEGMVCKPGKQWIRKHEPNK